MTTPAPLCFDEDCSYLPRHTGLHSWQSRTAIKLLAQKDEVITQLRAALEASDHNQTRLMVGIEDHKVEIARIKAERDEMLQTVMIVNEERARLEKSLKSAHHDCLLQLNAYAHKLEEEGRQATFEIKRLQAKLTTEHDIAVDTDHMLARRDAEVERQIAVITGLQAQLAIKDEVIDELREEARSQDHVGSDPDTFRRYLSQATTLKEHDTEIERLREGLVHIVAISCIGTPDEISEAAQQALAGPKGNYV